MLVFVDESEWPRPKDPKWIYCMGRHLHPSRSREFFREVYQLERKFWKVLEPYEFEIKGRLLLSRTGVTSPKKREFCEELISLCKLNGVRAFAARNFDTTDLEDLTEPTVELTADYWSE